MRLALCLLLLSSTATVLAQNSTPPSVAHLTMLTTPPWSLACPVGMTAERQASGQREWIVSLEDALQLPPAHTTRTNNAGVRVELVGFQNKALSRAEVAVYYMAPGVHVLPATQRAASLPQSDLKKTFVLSAANGESALQLAGSLLVGPAASVTRVRLLSITYADGSTWKQGSGSDCTVEPGLLMAVAGR